MLEGRILKYLNMIKHVYIDNREQKINSSSQPNITLSKSEHDSILELVRDVN